MGYKLLLQPHILNLHVLVPHLFIADLKEKKHSPQTVGILWLITLSKEINWFPETYIGDHLPSGLISLPVVGPFLFLLQNPFPGGAVLQGKFTNDPAELVYVHFPDRIRRMPHKKQKGMEPARKNNRANDFSFKEQKLII